MNICSGTASADGLMSTDITAARQMSISNRADGVACAVRYCVALLGIAFICAMNGRIPRSTTGEYIVTNDERHYQYRSVCGARASILKSKKNIFSIAPIFGWTVPAGKSTRNPSILANWANTFFYTDKPSYPKVPLIAAWTCSCASVTCCRLPALKKSCTKVNTTHMHSA
jgi:hypothetical protein